MPALLTTEQLMELLQLKDRTTVWKWRKKGLPFLKVGGSVRFDWDAVKAWIESRGEGKA